MMKNNFILLLCLILCISTFSQQKDTLPRPRGCIKHLPPASAEKKFQDDLKANKISIYLLGGIVSVIKKEDLTFEKEYSINYHDFGCTPPSNFEFYEKYNQLVFEFLSKKYGKTWIASTNANAFGFQKWKME